MPEPLPITSATNPRVKRLVRWRSRPAERRGAGVALAEGVREVERALEAGLVCTAWWACPQLLGGRTVPAAPPGVERLTCPAAVFERIAWHRRPEGLLGEFVAPRARLDDLPPAAAAGLYLVAVGTEKPGNLGAMVRTAAAAGCDAVLAVGPHVDPFHPAAVRNSTAAVFHLPVVAVAEPEAAIAFLRARGIALHAALVGGGPAPATGGPVAVVIGPEDRGLAPTWAAAADAAIGIPMAPGPVDSLNAAAAAAVLLFDAARGRWSFPPQRASPL
ncbi:TrmH family RNA methyltransferase [Phycisphaera mikurensis]|uniref:Putative RNA methyltransferase n=1 Tax=Phycisphaera mikurensis (strain NBRC 102666 / KCTC 22515 / FYK2301M01) TaxID=1142394 RepID=I0IB22_PHYMF|nr:RNA methyltransferase [Phycisphaera mikurensis]MBB6442569.1 TrmH family RNA methyltransferase [Phycisphaera mikurensis]BAM02460.1 putative RNA methyltransferase [Phycisphaera mikurensis NBRC 102666]